MHLFHQLLLTLCVYSICCCGAAMHIAPTLHFTYVTYTVKYPDSHCPFAVCVWHWWYHMSHRVMQWILHRDSFCCMQRQTGFVPQGHKSPNTFLTRLRLVGQLTCRDMSHIYVGPLHECGLLTEHDVVGAEWEGEEYCKSRVQPVLEVCPVFQYGSIPLCGWLYEKDKRGQSMER